MGRNDDTIDAVHVLGEPTAHECDKYLFWCSSLREYLVDQQSHAAATSAGCVYHSDSGMIAKNNDNESGFDVGDHVYLWCDVAGFSKVYQHHGIVIGVRRGQPQEEKVDHEQKGHDNHTNNNSNWILNVADFSLIDDAESPASLEQFGQLCASTSTASTSGAHGTCGGFKVYESPAHKWLKVRYTNDAEAERGGVDLLQENDACKQNHEASSIYHSPPQVVRARVEFLLQRPELLPSYLLHESNCECVAVWAKTGRYQTRQIEYWLQGTVENGAWVVGGAQLAAMTALSAVPFLVPAVVTYGAVTAGASAVALWKAKQHWNETTKKLNHAFAQHVAAYQGSNGLCDSHGQGIGKHYGDFPISLHQDGGLPHGILSPDKV